MCFGSPCRIVKDKAMAACLEGFSPILCRAETWISWWPPFSSPLSPQLGLHSFSSVSSSLAVCYVVFGQRRLLLDRVSVTGLVLSLFVVKYSPACIILATTSILGTEYKAWPKRLNELGFHPTIHAEAGGGKCTPSSRYPCKHYIIKQKLLAILNIEH